MTNTNPGPSYYWKITKDHTNDGLKGLSGPSGCNQTLKTNPARFSIYCDDMECHAEGMIYGNYDGFEPLDDFGTGGLGCVHIKIDGEWL